MQEHLRFCSRAIGYGPLQGSQVTPRRVSEWGRQTARAFVRNLRRNPGDDAENPAYTFNEPRIGRRVPKGKVVQREEMRR